MTRQADDIAEARNQNELSTMTTNFLLKLRNSTTINDLEGALQELGPKRTSYIFSENRDKTYMQISWERIVYENRWHSADPDYGEDTSSSLFDELVTDLENLLVDSPQESNVRAFVDRARDMQLPNTLKIREFDDEACDFWTVVNGTFRKIDHVMRF